MCTLNIILTFENNFQPTCLNLYVIVDLTYVTSRLKAPWKSYAVVPIHFCLTLISSNICHRLSSPMCQFFTLIPGPLSCSTALRNHQGSAVQLDQGRPESCLRLPVQHARGLRDAREETNPLYHVNAHKGHLLCQKILNVTRLTYCHHSFKFHIKSHNAVLHKLSRQRLPSFYFQHQI